MVKLGNNTQASDGGHHPLVSVIVPVRDGAGYLAASLPALRASDFTADAWELIVVDDGSADWSAELAGRHADLLLSTPGRGPAAARNEGVRHARGELLVFIDADVSVHRDTLRRFHEIFAGEPDVAAVFGAYDTSPRAPGLVSQYRNLLHHRIHAEAAGDAETFWAGCGAIRRAAFDAAGGFDESMRQLEDIDLGYRVRGLGYRIVLHPEIQGTHLKRWTLGTLIHTDLFGRGLAWMRLHLAQGRGGRPGTLNLRPAEKAYTLLAGLAAVFVLLGCVLMEPVWFLAAALASLVVLVGNVPLLRWFRRQRGLWFAVAVVPLRLLYYLLNAIAAAIGLVRHLLRPRSR
jgi:cellulose synthase/poly-beta-1,6-N-acetylglucosamine synthase-like glycosyltransferase